jgi:hypothetical protein
LNGGSSDTPSVLVWNGFMEQVTGGLDFGRPGIIILSFIGAL